MTVNLKIGWWISNKLHLFDLYNVNLQDNISSVKQKIKNVLDISFNIDLIFCGQLLENNKTLSSYNVISGSVLYIDNTKIIYNYDKELTLTQLELDKFILDFKTAMLTPGFIKMTTGLCQSEIFNKLLKAVPSLRTDPAACSMLKDPSLLITLTNPEVTVAMVKQHPSLILAANYLLESLIKERNPLLPALSPTLSDEENTHSSLDDDSSSSNTTSSSALNGDNATYVITPEQLAAAIDSANGNETEANINTGTYSNNLFTHALRNALTFSQIRSEGSEMGIMDAFENDVDINESYQSQLIRMHELGLFNDRLNVRALEISAGDLDAAVELILNDILG